MANPTHSVPLAALYPYASISEEAKRELQHASQVAQQKTGKIELYSPKYYTACTIGGVFACVPPLFPFVKKKKKKNPIPNMPPRALHIRPLPHWTWSNVGDK